MDTNQQNTSFTSKQTNGLMTIESLPEGLLDQLIKELDTEDVAAIMLHGSYARGEATPYSDIDLVRIVQEASSLPRQKQYSWREGYLISLSSRPISTYQQWFTIPEEAIFRVRGVQEALILLDKDGTFPAFQQEAQAFRWEPLQKAADEYISQLLLAQTEIVLHAFRAKLRNDNIALADMVMELFSASTDAIAVQRGIMVRSGNTYYHQAQEAAGKNSLWTRYHLCAAGINPQPPFTLTIEDRSVAALRLYQETFRLLQPVLRSEHRVTIEPLIEMIEHVLANEKTL
ncbi:MAG: nucleotidyltransferase domain-containing protein [Ktedonobacteraceae bacterium]